MTKAMEYLESLNPPQREAVINVEGPMMIIAGAGSGKTRVLTYRIAFLLEHGVEPFNILSLTFTNKAAKEMRERIEHIVGDDAKSLWMGTFHAVFAKLLRYEADKLGYQSNFTIYDTDDSQSVIKDILKFLGLDDKVYKPNGVLSRISSAKNKLISANAYANDRFMVAEDAASNRPKIAEIYKEYVKRCYKANAMDFDDILFNTNVLFQQHNDVLNKYQHRFKYVLIDEFQDTNVSQYLIVKKIAQVHQNICVVGDDAQSIYAFRGANIENILNFEKDYPSLKVVKLEQNYRSSGNIVEAANSIIRHNKNQLKKKVWTSNSEGALIELIKAANDAEEARLVANSIFEEKMQQGLSNKEFAILYRTNSQSRAIEESLRKLSIKYKVIGGLSFYQRKEVKDLVAYLRFVTNPSDMEAFKRIINYPKRGIGDTTVDKLVIKAAELNLSVWEVLENVKLHMGVGRATNLLDEFATMIKAFMLTIKAKDAFEATSYIAKQSGILKELYDDKTPEGKVRYDNLQELLNAIKGFSDDPENEDKSLQAFLQQVALVSSADTDTDGDAVTLMTIHMSKGLEFRNVYIVGLEENLFPSSMMLASREDLEEERRLFYVAVTRAKTRLFVSYALQRYRYGNLMMCEPSRFLNEIDSRFISVHRSGFSAFQSSVKSFGQAPKPTSTFVKNPVNQQVAYDENFKPTDAALLKSGQNVFHQKFGKGIITLIEDFGNDRRAKVNFEVAGEKALILSFAKLMVIEG